MKNKIYLSILLVLLMPFVLAETNLGTFKQNECIELKQICTNCTYINISSVVYPDSNQALGMVQMTKLGTEYNYTFCEATQLGTYTVNGFGDDGGTKEIFVYDFEVTPTGFVGTTGFYFLILILSLGIIVLGIYMQDATIVILGSLGLYFIGLYILFYGIDGLRDGAYTWAIAIIIIMLAAYISLKAAMELIED